MTALQWITFAGLAIVITCAVAGLVLRIRLHTTTSRARAKLTGVYGLLAISAILIVFAVFKLIPDPSSSSGSSLLIMTAILLIGVAYFEHRRAIAARDARAD